MKLAESSPCRSKSAIHWLPLTLGVDMLSCPCCREAELFSKCRIVIKLSSYPQNVALSLNCHHILKPYGDT